MATQIKSSVQNVQAAAMAGMADIGLIGEFIGINYLAAFLAQAVIPSVPYGIPRNMAMSGIGAIADISKMLLFNSTINVNKA